MARANQLMLELHTFPLDALIRERLAWLAQPLQAAQMRAEDSRARHWGGSGLGLCIAAAICQTHGGALEFGNREGGGLCAQVRLPAMA
ncbi:ATP-binding protein [Xanthomonas graminis]|jgi:putative hemolysin|uniref:histidine kinase n=1 Tax=Xanthomonas graminis pv. graminis TaxID=134874 RepID=A0A1M4IJA4_9XANT|nr:ATP-binding protein [Xanthomonas translucens]EKU24646.1 hypothetical protein XTG29_02473 [Xanthomonas translucens pv. graminis ART-Xtg29]OAX60062.1 hypothetical protein A6R72_15495 [Xanthomonas translucens pv. graminis]SBV41836.1 two-component system sensor protein [Xanthomonas translucens pv. graminis]SBV42458.1 two-component system sensor protein [Xanthomonas translucens pv. graminis]SBV47248.1 two-component system sensor protein [Xanthomonas translucens pv. graminis ART-Xtg29]